MAYRFDNITVLIVEDNQPMTEIVKSLLLTFGVGTVLTAKNGKEGFKLFNKYNPDLIIADWMMKPVDGISLTKQIRNSKDTANPFVPIILMTGFSQKKRVIEARDSGVTEFLVKPFSARELYRRIVQVIERPRQFIKCTGFFGPDRRRKKGQDYTGPLRRMTDIALEAIRERERRRAHETLTRIRTEKGLKKGDKFGTDSPALSPEPGGKRRTEQEERAL